MCKIVESTATCTLKETNISKISYSTDIPGNRAFSFYFFPYLGQPCSSSINNKKPLQATKQGFHVRLIA